ncbi:MAG TPA: VWA domain-containing protein [Terracidiphilus sp.]|jgi:VWFA-related protein
MKKAALIILLAGIALSRLSAQQPEATPPTQPQPTAQEQPAQTPPPAQAPSAAQTPNVAPTPNPAQAPNATQPVSNGTGGYTMRITSRLVVLDMVVVDKKGVVVKDLQRSNFSVVEAGEPQTILNFEVAGAHIPSPEININSTAALDRLAPNAPVDIILLDEFNTRFEDMAFARYSLKKYLDKQPDKLVTPTMLIAVSLQHFTVLHDYTQNKEEILSALKHHFAANPWQVNQGAWVGERYATAFITLRRVAQAVMGHPGHKNMIWIGRGFPPSRYLLGGWSLDTENRINNAVQDCVNVLRDARVTLYTIDPAGVMIDPGVYGGDPLVDPFGGNYEFNRMAKATGGRTLYGRNDVDAEVQTAIQDGANFYTLTYRPTNNTLDPQKFRKIKVTVDRPDLKVITREGYYLEYGPGRVNPENPSRRMLVDLAAADSSNMVYDGVPVTARQVATDPDSFILNVDGRGLVWSYATEGHPRQTEVILDISTFDKKGKELKREGRLLKFAAPPSVPPTGRILRNLNIPCKIDHNPKAVRVRFTVRVSATGRIGTADFMLGQEAGKEAPKK